MDRLNQLKEYMKFYADSGMGQGGVSSTTAGGVPLTYYNIGDGPRARNAADWASKQISSEYSSPQTVPDFFGGGGQGGYQPAQYAPPQTQNSENPMGSSVTNYLQQLLNGNRPNQQRNGTQGFRG